MSIRRRLPALLLLAACSGEPRTSATTGNASQLWTVDAKPVLDIGSESDSAETFGDVAGVARRGNGGIVVADHMVNGLRYFGPDGRYERTVGRAGVGPGEFAYLSSMIRCGDSLVTLDISRERFTIFSIEGTLGRNVPQAGVGPAAYKQACNSSGLFINYGWDTTVPVRPGEFRSDVPYWISRLSEKPMASLGIHPSSDRWAMVAGKNAFTVAPMPLGKEPAVAIGRTRAYIATGDTSSIAVYALDGSPLGTIGEPGPPIRTTPADIERYEIMDTLGKPISQKNAEVMFFGTVRFPETLPPYTQLLVDVDDNLWVKRFPRATDTAAHWVIFSPDGKQLAHADLPLNFQVHEIGTDYVLGTDAEMRTSTIHVKVLRLHK